MVHRSFWLEQALKGEKEKPSLKKITRSDVTIIGGGCVGLWAAIRIKELDSNCDVVLLEKDVCGGGASGRSGGFVLSWWPKIASLVRLFGVQEAKSIAEDSEKAIQEISDFCRENQIDAHFEKSPWLWTATSRAQLGAWESVVQACEKTGRSVFRNLSSQEVASRSGSSVHLAGVIDETAATVQPAILVRGLRRVALDKGVRIYENTNVLSFSRSNPVRVVTDLGKVISKKLIIANNAWAAGIRELSRALVPITSDMIATAPMPEKLKEVGWTGGECITDSQMMVDYYRITRDGRVAFGKGGWGIAYGGNLGADFDRNPGRARAVTEDFRRYYPSLRNVEITHDWSGPIDRTPTSLPILGHFKKNKDILYGVGWSGNGLGPSVIGGRVLASLALEKNDRWANYPLVGVDQGSFPPEPIRYIGAHLVRAAVAKKEHAEIQNHKPPFLARQLAKFAPAGLEDH